jgi:hypothetical protein
MIDNPVTLLSPACDIESGKRSGGRVRRNLQPQELESSLSPRETNPVLHAFMHLSNEAKRQYPRGLRLPFDYLNMPEGDLEERAQVFLVKAKENPQWAQDSITYHSCS